MTHRLDLAAAHGAALCMAASLALTPSSAGAKAPSPDRGPNVTILSQSGAVAADNPLASAAGAAVLERGGSAADAGVAALLALGVVNPFASGLGGGGFCLYRDAETGQASALDFRERAPKRASRAMYMRGGQAVSDLSRRGGLAVAVPSEAVGLAALHERFGELAWSELVAPAHELASRGFYVNGLLPKRLRSKEAELRENAHFVRAFQRGGEWVKKGDFLRRPDLAKTLKALSEQGAEAFRRGPIPDAIARAAGAEGGVLKASDLSRYEVVWREPLRGTYRDRYEIIVMPPPSSGGVAILETLNILEGYDLAAMGRNPASRHLIIEALKHAFADRARWLGDADFVQVPVSQLTSKAYAAQKRAQIRPSAVGEPTDYGKSAPPPNDSGTTHVSVVDADGDLLACTSTINTSFGSMVYVPEWGIVLNNEMDDFSAEPGAPNAFGLVGSEQNAIAPNKRPLSSMSPTIVLDQGAPLLAVGASGGPTIITGTLLALVRALDFGATPTEAVTWPRLHHQWMPYRAYLEPDRQGSALGAEELRAAGHEIVIRPGFNAVQLVMRAPGGGWVAVSDPRKMGRPAAPPPPERPGARGEE